MNKPLTPEEAKNLTFPCLLEVWDNQARTGHCAVIGGITADGRFKTTTSIIWQHAALPSPEITEAMRKQFAPESEYPKRMLVWSDDEYESNAKPRIVLADLGEKVNNRYIIVPEYYESEFENGETISLAFCRNAKPIPEPDAISQEIAELRQRLADLEAKQNQQS